MGDRNQSGARSGTLTRRRALAAASAVVLPVSAFAQTQPRIARIGVLHWDGPGATFRIDEISTALAGAGYREGVNVVFEWRWAAGSRARAAEAAAELERMGVSMIYVHATPATHAVKDVVKHTPVVFNVADALATGIVSNLTRPGGLLTGVTTFSPDLAPKRLEILREAVPNLTRVGFLASSIDPNAETFVRETSAAGDRLGIAIVPVRVQGPDGFAAALDQMAGERVQAVVVQTLFVASSQQFMEPALRRGLPSIGDQPLFAEKGALVAFGADRANLAERAAAQIDRILKGANPGDIPVEGPTKFWLAINQKTARTLGLTLPPSLLIRADEVIE